MGRREKYTKEAVAAALVETKGMVTLAARKIGCDITTMYRYIEKYPLCRQARGDATETMLDAVELALYDEAVTKRNTAALIFLAKTKGKQRGYVERVENINLNVDTALVKQAIEAMEAAGLTASDVFNDIIAEAERLKQHVRPDGVGAADND